MKSKTIIVDEREIVISRLPIGKYSELLSKIERLPKHVGGLSDLSTDLLIEKLPFFLAVALPDVFNILAVATPLTKEELEELGLAEITEIVITVFEVNDYQRVFEMIKKAIARQNEKK